MHVHLNPVWAVHLNKDELRLISLGLAGRLNEQEDIIAAQVLLDSLNKQQMNALQDRLNFLGRFAIPDDAKEGK